MPESPTSDAFAITVSVAVTRLDQFKSLVASLTGQPEIGDRILVVLDGVSPEEAPDSILAANGQPLRIDYLHHESMVGLSHCRNRILDQAPTRFLVFLDDDTVAAPDLIARYRRRFAEDQQVVGGRLCLPEHYPTWPAWLPRTYGSLLGIHQSEAKIWGGNFGFDRQFALRHGISFAPSLGRYGQRLWSGDDTTFVKALEALGARVLFDPAIVAYHHIAISRFSLPYLLRRAYWQGRSEVLRKSIAMGLQKEFRRAFGRHLPGSAYDLKRGAVGALLFASVVLGVTIQLAQGLPFLRPAPAPG